MCNVKIQCAYQGFANTVLCTTKNINVSSRMATRTFRVHISHARVTGWHAPPYCNLAANLSKLLTFVISKAYSLASPQTMVTWNLEGMFYKWYLLLWRGSLSYWNVWKHLDTVKIWSIRQNNLQIARMVWYLKSSSAVSNPNGLLNQKVCHYLYQGRIMTYHWGPHIAWLALILAN